MNDTEGPCYDNLCPCCSCEGTKLPAQTDYNCQNAHCDVRTFRPRATQSETGYLVGVPLFCDNVHV